MNILIADISTNIKSFEIDNVLARFSNLGEDIPRQLNVESLASFREVSKTRKDFTDSHKPIYEKMFLKSFYSYDIFLKMWKTIMVRIPTTTIKELAVCFDVFSEINTMKNITGHININITSSHNCRICIFISI